VYIIAAMKLRLASKEKTMPKELKEYIDTYCPDEGSSLRYSREKGYYYPNEEPINDQIQRQRSETTVPKQQRKNIPVL
jgi:hypothetical protein